MKILALPLGGAALGRAGLGDALFWWSLGVSLVIAFAFALPLNRWLMLEAKDTPSSTPTTATEMRGYSASKGELLKRLARAEGQVRA